VCSPDFSPPIAAEAEKVMPAQTALKLKISLIQQYLVQYIKSSASLSNLSILEVACVLKYGPLA
jgi:hypothetical protein